MNYLRLLFITYVVSLCGCDLQPPPVTVVVYPSSGRCAVMQDDKEQPVECGQVGQHLRDVLKIAANRQIDVSLPGIETVSKEDHSIDLIAERIRALGYQDVRTSRFGL